MAIHYVQVLVDCVGIVEYHNSGKPADPSKHIQMFASPAIVYTGQGSDELGIQVNDEDIIRWSAFPMLVQPLGSGEDYSVIITRKYDWKDDVLIKDWTAHQGYTSIWTYKNDGQSMGQEQDVPVMRASDYLPFVQATAAISGRPDPGTVAGPEAYRFAINIYQGNNDTPLIPGYEWDPYVKVKAS